MLAKYWKKIGLFILIVACIFNVMTKIKNAGAIFLGEYSSEPLCKGRQECIASYNVSWGCIR